MKSLTLIFLSLAVACPAVGQDRHGWREDNPITWRSDKWRVFKTSENCVLANSPVKGTLEKGGTFLSVDIPFDGGGSLLLVYSPSYPDYSSGEHTIELLMGDGTAGSLRSGKKSAISVNMRLFGLGVGAFYDRSNLFRALRNFDEMHISIDDEMIDTIDLDGINVALDALESCAGR